MRTYLLALACAMPGVASAPPPASPPPAATVAPGSLTVEAAVQAAIARNPRLTAVVREISAAQAGVRSARALTNPQLLFTPAITRGGSDEELLLQQPLELNGTRSARAGIARADLRQTEARAVVELRELVAQTRRAYVEAARTRELLALAREVARFAEEVDQAVRRQSEEGLRPGIDSVQTGIEARRTRQQVTLAESEVRQAEAALNTLMGRPATEPLEAIAPLTFTPEPLPEEQSLPRALQSRAEVQRESAIGQGFREQARLARAEGRPDLVPQVRSEDLLRAGNPPALGIGITLPLLDWGSRRNRVRQAEASARAQEARVEATRNQIRQEVEQALARLRAAESVIREYQTGILEQSRQLRDAGLRALQLGAPGASILTALEAQRTYRTVLTEYTNALAQHAQARAELERATGAVPATLLPTGNTTPSTGGTR